MQNTSLLHVDNIFDRADMSESELEDEVRRGRKEGKRGHHDKWHNRDYQNHYKHLIPEGPRQRHSQMSDGQLMPENSESSFDPLKQSNSVIKLKVPLSNKEME